MNYYNYYELQDLDFGWWSDIQKRLKNIQIKVSPKDIITAGKTIGKVLPVVGKALLPALPIVGGVALAGTGAYLLYKELERRKKLKENVKVKKIGNKKIIDLRDLAKEKAKEYQRKIINLKPVVEQKVQQKTNEQLLYMGIPLGLLLLL